MRAQILRAAENRFDKQYQSADLPTPAGKPVVRIATFSKGRTTVAIDYSDGREPDVTKMGSRAEWWAFLAERRP